VLATTSVSLLDPYLDQIKFLRTELAGARREITSLRTQLTTVEAQVARLTTGLAT
jgi:hypothetical protein